ncbi:MAG TPA: MgtC/SapB family protein [Gemmatimonadaceae bacterium]
MPDEELWATVARLVSAFALAVPIAWERERSTRIMGLRTFPLVALASCGYVLIAVRATDPADADARIRALPGLMTGIGFVGGGAIVKHDSGVRGTATAASVWGTGAINSGSSAWPPR